MLGWDAVKDVRWDWLQHAYGTAEGTPEILRGLTGEEATLRAKAIDYLDWSVLHQGNIYSVTPPVVRLVAGLLNEPILRAPLKEPAKTLRAKVATLFGIEGATGLDAVLSFLGSVGESLGWALKWIGDEELADESHEWLNQVADFRDMAPEVIEAILPFVQDENPRIAREAMNATSKWTAIQSETPGPAAEVLRARLEIATDRIQKSSLVLALGEMGQDVSDWLEDEDEAVRSCAALFVRTPQADEILIGALTHPERVDTWFPRNATPAYFPMNVRLSLLDEVIKRGVTIEELLPAAVALIKQTSGGLLAEYEWGPILQLGFPDAEYVSGSGVRPPLPEHLTPAQHAVLEALLANKTLWDPVDGNASLARTQVGVPDTREELATYLHQTPVQG